MSASVWDVSTVSDQMLSDDELLRYSRQILLKQIDVQGQLRLKQGRVLIVGMGGLGSPVALYLAAAGVGELHLADFDTVDLTNLQRQIAHDTASIGQAKVDSAMARLAALRGSNTESWPSRRIAAPETSGLPAATQAALTASRVEKLSEQSSTRSTACTAAASESASSA